MYQQIKTWTKSGLGFTENLILVTLGLILSKFFYLFPPSKILLMLNVFKVTFYQLVHSCTGSYLYTLFHSLGLVLLPKKINISIYKMIFFPEFIKSQVLFSSVKTMIHKI